MKLKDLKKAKDFKILVESESGSIPLLVEANGKKYEYSYTRVDGMNFVEYSPASYAMLKGSGNL